MKHITQEDILRELAAGNCTIKGLAAKFGLTTGSMKGILANLAINSKEREPEPEPIIMNNCPASEEDEWDQLYKDYDSEGAQAQLLIAQCRIKDGMTAAQARQYMKDNFHYQIIEVKFNKKRRYIYDSRNN